MSNQDLKELTAFLESEGSPNASIDQSLRTSIHHQLHPSLALTFMKMFLLTTIGSFATLLLCPQFSIGFMGPIGVMSHWLMNVHPTLCFFICGVIWMLPGLFIVSWALTIDELRILKKYYVFGPLSVMFFSPLFFANQDSLSVESWVVAWILGAAFISVLNARRLTKRLKKLSSTQAGFAMSAG